MEEKNISFFKRTDLIIITVILVLSLAGWLVYRAVAADRPAKAEIYHNGTLVKTVVLISGREEIFTIPQDENVVFHQYPDGSICFEQSDCPDKVCIHAGRLSMVGQSAACLPNGIVLKIIPDGDRNPEDPDIVVGN